MESPDRSRKTSFRKRPALGSKDSAELGQRGQSPEGHRDICSTQILSWKDPVLFGCRWTIQRLIGVNTLGTGDPQAVPLNTCTPGAWNLRPRAPAQSALSTWVRRPCRWYANDQIQRWARQSISRDLLPAP